MGGVLIPGKADISFMKNLEERFDSIVDLIKGMKNKKIKVVEKKDKCIVQYSSGLFNKENVFEIYKKPTQIDCFLDVNVKTYESKVNEDIIKLYNILEEYI